MSGGFDGGGGTKFPQSPVLGLLLTDYRSNGTAASLQTVVETLDAIAFGGIHDHLAGGVHRLPGALAQAAENAWVDRARATHANVMSDGGERRNLTRSRIEGLQWSLPTTLDSWSPTGDGTVVGIIPGTLAIASVGAGLDAIIVTVETDYAACLTAKGPAVCTFTINAGALLNKQLVGALVLLGIIALVPVVLRRRRQKPSA